MNFVIRKVDLLILVLPVSQVELEPGPCTGCPYAMPLSCTPNLLFLLLNDHVPFTCTLYMDIDMKEI